MVKNFEYIEYTMKENGKQKGQIKKLKEKASTVMSSIWELGVEIFREN